jgi:hypothetical protein
MVLGTQEGLTFFRTRHSPTSHMIKRGEREQPPGDTMIKTVCEERIIHIDNEELARLLGLEPGFTLQHIEEAGMDFQLIFSRKADLSETLPRREDRRSFL